MEIIINAVGLFGVVLILAAYFLLENDTLKSSSKKYLLLNLVGSLMILASLLHDWNLASFMINSAWAVISIYGLIKYRNV